MRNTVHLGDCLDIMPTIADKSVDMVLTSPPYDNLRTYNGSISWSFEIFQSIAKELFRVVKDGGVVVWVVGDKIANGNRSLTSFMHALYFQKIGFNVHDVMIYQKKNTPFMRSNAYTNCYEFMFVFSKGAPNVFNPLKTATVRNGFEGLPYNKMADGINKKVVKELKKEKTLTNIWQYAVGFGGSTSDKIAFQHPAIFPEKLAADHILSWSNEGDCILDPFAGSGTTAIAAINTGREYILIEKEEKYCQIIEERIASRINRNKACEYISQVEL